MGSGIQVRASEIEISNNYNQLSCCPDWKESLSQTKQTILQTQQPDSPTCHDDFCDPVPKEIFILIGLQRKDLFDYCRMRIFNSLFSWREIEDELREIIWPKLLRIEEYQSTSYRQLYAKLVKYPNADLDQEIEHDETRKRFKVRTSVPGVMIKADEDKLVRVIRAYGIFDPEVFYK